MIFPFGALQHNVAAFCDLLRREYGYRVGPRELRDAMRAIEVVGLSDERRVRDALRPVLVGRLEDVRTFDGAFERFFRSRGGGPPPRDIPGTPAGEAPVRPDALGSSAGGPREARPGPDDDRAPAGARRAVLAVDEHEGEPAHLRRASYSPLRAAGPALVLDPADREWRDAAARLVSRVHAGLSRRWRPARRGPRFDFRRTLRTALHTGGDLVSPRYRARSRTRPRFVLLLDGSRSMEPHTRPALQLAAALSSVTPDVETFSFSTSLRRITGDVRRAAAGERRVLQLEDAWGGGTTIGACLRDFLNLHASLLAGREAFVFVASDGLDVGDLDLLRDAMARLFRLSAAVVWLNPLVDLPGYAPTAGGMNVARPFVTALTSASTPSALARLASSLRVR